MQRIACRHLSRFAMLAAALGVGLLGGLQPVCAQDGGQSQQARQGDVQRGHLEADKPGEAKQTQAAKAIGQSLQATIDAEFIETPLSRALERIERQTRVNVLIDPQYKDALASKKLTLRFDQASAADALDRLCLATGADWVINEGVVFVSTKREIRSRRVTRQVYDIRPLLMTLQSQIGPSLNVDQSLSNTNSGGSNPRQSRSRGGGGGGMSIFGDSRSTEDSPSRGEAIRAVTELIKNNVGQAKRWMSKESGLREINGHLIVRTVPEEQHQIKQLLGDLSKMRQKLVAIQAVAYRVPSNVVQGLVEENDDSLVAEGNKLDQWGSSLDQAGQRLGVSRLVGFNAQRVFVYAGSDKTFLSDAEPIPEAGAADPTLSTLRSGFVLDVLPTISFDKKHVVVTVKSDLVTEARMQTKTYPLGGRAPGRNLPMNQEGSITGKLTPKDRSDDDFAGDDQDQRAHDQARPGAGKIEGELESSGDLRIPGKPIPPAQVELDTPAQDMVTYRTTIRIPDGGGVLLSGVSKQIAKDQNNAEADDRAEDQGEGEGAGKEVQTEVVLLLKVRVVD